MEISELIHTKEHIEPETVRQLFPNMEDLDRQKILALRVLKHAGGAFVDYTVFENVCLVLNDIVPSVNHTEGCQPEHIWLTMDVIRRMYPSNMPYITDEIRHYVKFIFRNNGYQFYPKELQIEGNRLDEVKTKAENGPFPLTEDPLDIQASRFLRLQEYLKKHKISI